MSVYVQPSQAAQQHAAMRNASRRGTTKHDPDITKIHCADDTKK